MDIATEADYEELAQLCKELEVPYIEHFWSYEVVNLETGKVVVPCKRQRSRSWTRNFYNMITCQFCSLNSTDNTDFGNEHLNYMEMDGNIWGSAVIPVFPWLLESPQTNDTYGILVGTDDSVETFNDFQLQGLISHGKAGGELYHFKTESPLHDWAAGTRKFTFTFRRVYNNHSGGGITVKEIALVNWSPSFNVLLVRDLLDSPVVLADDDQLRTSYAVTSIVYPS